MRRGEYLGKVLRYLHGPDR